MAFRVFSTTMKRFAAGTMDHGRYTNGAATDSSIVCGIQQPTPDDLELLPEGKRTGRVVVLFTTAVLQLATKTANADWVLIDGEWFEVAHLKPFKTLFPGNFKAICTKIENPGDIPLAAA